MLNPVEWVPGILNVCQLNRGIAMRQSLRGNILLTVAAYWSLLGGQPVAQADEFHLNGRTFTLPAGFEIELVAGPPLVDRPIVADFDEQGRLYVADSSGSNDRVEKQLREKPHRILRLEDTDGDGRFDRRTVFADQMMFPEGAHVVRRIALRRRAAEHLEADRHLRRRRGRPAWANGSRARR